MRFLLVSLVLLTGNSVALADEPAQIAKDFCHAVAAQALCSKTFTMAKGTKKRMQSVAGQKLRGEGVSLNPQCEAGYSEFYNMESVDGLDAACRTTLGLFGPTGSRRAGLVQARGKPAMKLPEGQIEKMFRAVCYAEEAAKACPGLNMADGYDQKLSAATGVPAAEKRGYFRKACGQGFFRATLNKGEKGVTLSTFCAAAYDKYGRVGKMQPNLLVATAGAVTGNQNAASVTEQAAAAANEALAKVADQVCTALAETAVAAEYCPGVAQAKGMEDVLKVHLGTSVGKIEDRCKSIAAPNITPGKRAEFCLAVRRAYGPQGRTFPGMLTVNGDQSPAAKVQSAAAAPKAEVQPAGRQLVILEAVPPRPAGADPVKLLGQQPGTLTGAACAPHKANLAKAQKALGEATQLGERVARTLNLVVQGRVALALCPAEVAFAEPEGIVQEIKATGLEACHIVEAAGKELAKASRSYHKKRLYRALVALDEALVWSYEHFQPVCSSLTQKRMERLVNHTRNSVERNRSRYECINWDDFVRAEMKAAADLSRKRQLKQAIAALDTRVLPALYGVDQACDEKRSAYNKKRWLSIRKRYQLSMKP